LQRTAAPNLLIVPTVGAVRASGLVKRFETTTAVDHVDLELAEGEVRGLLGPNGAGKTTLLRLLFGLIRADEGTVELFGQRLAGPNSVIPDGVGGFIEDPSFYPYLPGRVNLELLAELDGGNAASLIDGALERVSLAHRGGDRVSGYSTGMRQRLGIAAALLRSPRLLLLDEPTAGLDPAGVRDIGTLVRSLSADGVAVLLSSHQIGEVEEVCDSFTVLRTGRVVWEGTAAELRSQAPGAAYRLATSDDARTLELAAQRPNLNASRTDEGQLTVEVAEADLDEFVLALGAAGVAVRRLEQLVGPLESMFFSLTEGEPTPPTQEVT
jgi:ABC-2 type transport system ATP-binding protein